MEIAVTMKPRKCLNCGSRKIATYLYGMPHCTPALKKALDVGTVVLGGCEIVDPMPLWKCVDCEADFLKSEKGRETS